MQALKLFESLSVKLEYTLEKESLPKFVECVNSSLKSFDAAKIRTFLEE
jgi:hypothetical protein